MLARAGFSLAMCGALAGVLFLTGQHGADDVSAAASAGTAPVAKLVASFEGSPGIYKSQMAVDASPVSVSLPAKIPVPVERAAEVSPALPKHAVATANAAAAIRKPEKRPVAVASAAIGFESCLPGCETRDPLITGSAQKAPDPGISPEATDELVEEVSLTPTTPSFLGRALHAPGAVYHKGRDVLTTLVRAAL